MMVGGKARSASKLKQVSIRYLNYHIETDLPFIFSGVTYLYSS
jgi:hypothetical protein